jgi:hypothetical protein
MSDRSFFDTNVLLYADDESAPAKQRRARDLVAEHRRAGTGVISLQVLQEYFVNVTRKLHVWPNLTSPLLLLPIFLLPLTSTGCTDFLFGMLWFSALPSNPAAVFFFRKTSNMAAKSMVLLS